MKKLSVSLAEMSNLGAELDQAKVTLAELQSELETITMSIPNLLTLTQIARW